MMDANNLVTCGTKNHLFLNFKQIYVGQLCSWWPGSGLHHILGILKSHYSTFSDTY